MKETTGELEQSQEMPFPVDQLGPEVFNSYDREQITELLVEKLKSADIDPKRVVYCGFDAEKVLAERTFGKNTTTTYGTGLRGMEEDGNSADGAQSAVRYLEDNAGNKPAIAVFDLDKLLGGIAEHPRELLDEVTPEMLDEGSYIYWETKNQKSLDEATKLLFLL